MPELITAVDTAVINILAFQAFLLQIHTAEQIRKALTQGYTNYLLCLFTVFNSGLAFNRHCLCLVS